MQQNPTFAPLSLGVALMFGIGAPIPTAVAEGVKRTATSPAEGRTLDLTIERVDLSQAGGDASTLKLSGVATVWLDRRSNQAGTSARVASSTFATSRTATPSY